MVYYQEWTKIDLKYSKTPAMKTHESQLKQIKTSTNQQVGDSGKYIIQTVGVQTVKEGTPKSNLEDLDNL